MCNLKINGGRRLDGKVKIQGAKNAVLPILAATVLCRGETVIHNCPDLSDVRSTLEILESLGCRTYFDGNTVLVNSDNLTSFYIPDELMMRMRSSIIFCGSLLSVLKKASLSYPGGCELGGRPIDLHLKAFRTLGAEVSEMHGRIFCDGSNMKPARICLDFPSVGATENIMLSSVFLDGVTTIVNAAKEPEIVDLQKFLNSMGAKISGAGSPVVTIEGVKKLCGCEYTVMPDRIVTATYMSALASAGGRIMLEGTVFSHIESVASVLENCGCVIIDRGDSVEMLSDGRIFSAGKIMTGPYPGFPTDAQAPVMAAIAKSKGTTVISENVFSGRYRHIPELVRMGANIVVNGKTAVVSGVDGLFGTDVFSCDLRGGAALAVAAVGANGVSRIYNVHYIDRGYEALERDFCMLGADCEREEEAYE